ncbi:MAG: PEGA domain-containing protein [Acidobacteriota bacterium]
MPSRRAITQWIYRLSGVLALLIAGAAIFYFSKPTVIVLTNVANATIYLDGEPRGATNQLNRFSLTHVPPGQHAIRLTHPEYLTTEQIITVEYGFFPTRVNLPLRPAIFTLTIHTEPMTTVRLDGVQVGETDPQAGVLAIPNVRVGNHQISLQRAGYLPFTSTLNMPESDYQLTFPLHLDLNGYWKGTWQEDGTGKAGEFIVSLGQTGATLSGLWEEAATTPAKPPRSWPVTGHLLEQQRLRLERKEETGRTLTFEGQVSSTGRDLLGTWQDGKRTGHWTANRSDTKPTLSLFPGLPTTVEPGPRLTTPPSLPLPPALPSTLTDNANPSPLARAQSLYEQRRYTEAIAECDAILKQNPKNNAARDLKRRIQKSFEILNASPDNNTTPSP